jgi:hypothetical protein
VRAAGRQQKQGAIACSVRGLGGRLKRTFRLDTLNADTQLLML